MTDSNDSAAQQEIAELAEINASPLGKRLAYFTKKSGPGWLQAAITLGGGSLAGSLFLGVILGYNLMWLQPFAMLLGVIMLSAVAYVTLSTGQRPFGAINKHVSPILGWAWLIAAAMANIVWCLPQFALASGAIQENLAPALSESTTAPWIIGAILFVIAATIVRSYESESGGVKIFDLILKVLVAIVVISFFFVVAKLTFSGSLDWSKIFAGFVPNLSYLKEPAPELKDAIAATGDNSAFWQGLIQGLQKDKIIAAFGTAVGINMTFLLPYSMLRKSWGRPHRQLAIFDLAIGLIVPFVLATGCILIASASSFHASSADILSEAGTPLPGMEGGYNASVDKLLGSQNAEFGTMSEEEKTKIRDAVPIADRQLAAMLVDRKDRNLALALKDIGGEVFGRYIFGIGVLGMAMSTIIILMLINGFCACEAFGRAGDKKLHFFGSLIPGLIGLCFPLIWTGESKAALAVPTSVIGSSLLPIAYFAFFLLMNSKKLLGDAMPTGTTRIILNILMGISTTVATIGSVWAIKGKSLGGVPVGKIGIGVLAVLFILGSIGFISKSKSTASDA